MNPLVTIGIPTLRRIDCLKEAVASALAQQYENIEILISDDGCSEQIANWGKEIAAADPRIRYWRNPQNLGLSGNWNFIADSAKGEFLVLIGDDDRLLSDFIGKTVEVATTNTSVVFTDHYVIDQSGKRDIQLTHNVSSAYGRSILSPGVLSEPEKCAWKNTIAISAALLRTDRVRELRFKEDLNNPEIELFIRLAKEQGRFVFVPEYLVEYRVHPGSETSSGLKSERLLKYLIDIPVSPELESDKREFLGALIVDAVGRLLRDHRVNEARYYIASKYYPIRILSARCWIQHACSRMGRTGAHIYRALYSFKTLKY